MDQTKHINSITAFGADYESLLLPLCDEQAIVTPQLSTASSETTAYSPAAVYQSFGQLRFVQYRFRIRFTQMAVLSPYKGGTLRGGIKWLFRENFCAYKELACSACTLQAECAYPRLFEVPFQPDERERRGQTYGTMSFILQPPATELLRFPPGAELSFGVVVVGPHIDTFPYLLCAVQELGQAGLGAEKSKEQGRFVLVDVEARQPDGWKKIFHHQDMLLPGPHSYTYASDIPIPSDDIHDVKVSFVTPTMIKVTKHVEKNDKVYKKKKVLHDFDFGAVFSTLVRRISFLLRDQEDVQAVLDYQALFATAAHVEVVDKQLQWYEWERYSMRWQQHMQFGGLKGHMTLKNVSALQLWLLQLGEYFHVGKRNSFGMGQIKVELR